MPILTELARFQDIEDMAYMSRDEVEHGLHWRYRPQRIHALLRTPDTTAVCVHFQSKHSSRRHLLGFGIMRLGMEDANIILLAVDRSVRRQGVGGSIMRWLEETAAVGGMRQITLEMRENNTIAQKFYESFGYVQYRRLIGYYAALDGSSEDALCMVKTLRST